MSRSPAERDKVVEAARRDLAQRLGVGVDAVRLVSVEARQWADASLGCPQPGKVYAQTIVDGFRLILETGGSRYDYRSDGRRVRLCERG